MRRMSVVVALVATVVPVKAYADRPWTGYVRDDAEIGPTALGAGTVIFFNRNGGTYHKGQNDSRTNSTSINGGTITPFSCGDDVWNQVMTCINQQFAPFNVVITDVDPGNSPHIETVVAGKASEILGSQGQGVGGIAPLGCFGGIDNAITFDFANESFYGCNVEMICWTAAQETAHAFGLDHQILCSDPMTYDQRCGPMKRFQDQASACGESSQYPPNQQPPNPSGARDCSCTGAATQNSYQMLLELFGPRGPDLAPELHITSPKNNATVQAGFKVKVDASDDVKVTKVELFIDGMSVTYADAAPFEIPAPATLGNGSHTVTARAYDTSNKSTDESIQVRVEPPCESNDDCESDQVCDHGQCIAGPSAPGGLGAVCTGNDMCDSQLCAGGPGGMKCTDLCTPGGSDCPSGFDCLDTGGGGGACWPGDGGGGGSDTPCGCAVKPGRHAPVWGFLLSMTAFALVLVRRRRW